MRTAILTTLTLLFALPASAVVERADIVATYIGGIGKHPISGDGSRVVFDDYQGTATDGDTDIYIWEQETGLTRITDEYPKPGLNYVSALDVDYDGTAVAAIARADLTDTGATTDELYRWTEESGWERLTFTPGENPVLFSGSMAISEDGTRVAFTSRGDHAGDNPDGELQVFLWDEGAGFTQVTHGFPCGDYGGNFLDDLSADGNRILFGSRCQYGDSNDDLDFDLFLWEETDGVRALTETKDGDTAASATLNRDGTIAALSSRFDLTGEGLSGTHLYRWVDGQGFSLLAKDVSRFAPSISADGSRIVYGAENGQGTDGINPEGTEELFFWQQGLADVAALTDSAQADQYFGNSGPHLSADGTRLSMFALRAFDAPDDLRTGHYLIDVLSPQKAQPNLLFNGSFDAGLRGWQVASNAVFSPEDGKEDPASGSAIQPNDVPAGGVAASSISQCVPATPDTEYLLSALLRVVPGANTGSARLDVHLYPTKGCAGIFSSFLTPTSAAPGGGAWIGAHGRFATGPSTGSVKVVLYAVKNEDGGYLEAAFDDVNLRRDNPLKVFP